MHLNLHVVFNYYRPTHKILQSGKPSYLHSCLNVQSNRIARSSFTVTLQSRPPVRSRLKLIDRYFSHHAPVLWNTTKTTSPRMQPSPHPSFATLTDDAPLAFSSCQFHSKLDPGSQSPVFPGDHPSKY